uniref:Uncharacterized protein n=1 Tax=Verrucosispora sp. MS100047 TaxID=1410949 RepID=A0A097CRL3_9ACTN|nr:hypothetical protein VASRM7_50 [Verrucosispora sp. MS100047]
MRRCQPGGGDQFGGEGPAVGVDVQQRGHGGQPFVGGQGGHRALPPERGKHLAVRRVAVGGGFVLPVAVADGGPFPDDRQAGGPEHLVGGDQVGQPVVDGRGGFHVRRRQSSHEAHVQHRQRCLDVVPVRRADVEEGADGLLGEVVVVALAEVHQAAAGHLTGEGDRQLVPPLPGVHRDEQVVGQVQVEGGHGLGEPGQGRLVQFGAEQGGVVEVGGAGEGGVVAVGGQPDQAYGSGGLGGVAVVFVDAEAEAAVVGHEAGMPFGHRRLDGLEVGLDQLRRRGQGPVQFVGAAGQGGADLLQVDRQDPVAEAERGAQVQAEVDGVEGLRSAVVVSGDAVRVDVPVLQDAQPGGEPVADGAAVAGHRVPACSGGGAVRLGGDQPLVGELGERLAYQQPVGPLPGLRAQVGDGIGGGRHSVAPWLRVAARNRSRVQMLSRACFSGLAIGPITSKPTAALRACTAVLRTSGSTTTRAVSGSANSQDITVVSTAWVKPCTGVSVGAQRKCMPTSPGWAS